MREEQGSFFTDVTVRHDEYVSTRHEPFQGAEFDGETYEPALDRDRLVTQLEAVRQIMADGRWYAIAVLARGCKSLTGKHATEASVSARIRDLRKRKFGGHAIERRRTDGGLFEYRLIR